MSDLVDRLRYCQDRGIYAAMIASPGEAADRITQLEAENADLRTSVIAFGAPWAVEYAKMMGLPDGHMFPIHYDILECAGGRMVDFVRHEDARP